MFPFGTLVNGLACLIHESEMPSPGWKIVVMHAVSNCSGKDSAPESARLEQANQILLSALSELMSTHRFNIASLPPSEVHSRAFNAIEAAEAVMAGLPNGLSKDSP